VAENVEFSTLMQEKMLHIADLGVRIAPKAVLRPVDAMANAWR
jgi:hypothetical protein